VFWRDSVGCGRMPGGVLDGPQAAAIILVLAGGLVLLERKAPAARQTAPAEQPEAPASQPEAPAMRLEPSGGETQAAGEPEMNADEHGMKDEAERG